MPDAANMRGRLTSIDDLLTFMYAGNATLTLVSVKTRTRFTFKLRRAGADEQGRERHKFWVNVLVGQDNEADYKYLGQIDTPPDRAARYWYGQERSRIGRGAPSNKAFTWFFEHVVTAADMRAADLEIWHEGRCCRCGRKLTVPESIARGIGPECAGRVTRHELAAASS